MTPVAPAPRTLALLRTLFALALVVVLVLSLLPLATPPALSTGWDKSDHLAAYCVLGVLGLASWPNRRGRVLVGLLVYGAVIELLQAFVPFRHPDWQDLLTNAAGLGLAQLAVVLRARFRRA